MTAQTRQKRYTVLKFPSLYGTPRSFSTRFAATAYGFWMSFWYSYVCELKDNVTGAYKAYWM